MIRLEEEFMIAHSRVLKVSINASSGDFWSGRTGVACILSLNHCDCGQQDHKSATLILWSRISSTLAFDIVLFPDYYSYFESLSAYLWDHLRKGRKGTTAPYYLGKNCAVTFHIIRQDDLCNWKLGWWKGIGRDSRWRIPWPIVVQSCRPVYCMSSILLFSLKLIGCSPKPSSLYSYAWRLYY